MAAPAKQPESIRKQSAAKKEEVKQEAEPAVDPKEEQEEEDFSHLPQERPDKIVYTRELILQFIEKEKAVENPEVNDDLDDLDLQIQNMQKSKDYGNSSRMDGGRRRPQKDYYNGKPSSRGGYKDDRDSKRYGGGGRPQDNYGSGYRKEPEIKLPTPGLARAVLTDEQKARLDDIKKATDDLVFKAKNADEDTILRKGIVLSLFKLTQETYNEVLDELKPVCQTPENCQTTILTLIDKAWSQTKYTEIYAKMCSDLGS